MDGITGATTGNKAVHGLLFTTSGLLAIDIFSKFNDSPDTPSESKYMTNAIAVSMFFAAGSSVIAGSPWPLIGAGVVNAYLYWLYSQKLEN